MDSTPRPHATTVPARGRMVLGSGREVRTDYTVVAAGGGFGSSGGRDAAAFLKGNVLTMGFSLSYGVHADTGDVVELFAKGRPGVRVLAKLVALGFTEWHYSWAFASKTWTVDGRPASFRKLDVTTLADVAPWAGLVGMHPDQVNR